MSQAMQVASSSWERHGSGFSLRASRRNCQRFDSRTCDLQNCERINTCGLKPLMWWCFVTAARGHDLPCPGSEGGLGGAGSVLSGQQSLVAAR